MLYHSPAKSRWHSLYARSARSSPSSLLVIPWFIPQSLQLPTPVPKIPHLCLPASWVDPLNLTPPSNLNRHCALDTDVISDAPFDRFLPPSVSAIIPIINPIRCAFMPRLSNRTSFPHSHIPRYIPFPYTPTFQLLRCSTWQDTKDKSHNKYKSPENNLNLRIHSHKYMKIRSIKKPKKVTNLNP